MLIGQRLREIRESKHLSQGEIEKRTGLLRCYTSRVENGHTIPSIETLEKYARALEVPLYKFFYEGSGPPKKLKLPPEVLAEWGADRPERGELQLFAKALSRMNDRKRKVLLELARGMARRARARGK